MQTITTIGLDIAKSVFQVHGVDAEGKVIIRRLCVPKTSSALMMR
jgi:transposase